MVGEACTTSLRAWRCSTTGSTPNARAISSASSTIVYGVSAPMLKIWFADAATSGALAITGATSTM